MGLRHRALLVVALVACNRPEKADAGGAPPESTAVSGLPTMGAIAPPRPAPEATKPKDPAPAKVAYKGSPEVGPCDDDRGCQVYNHCGTCRPLAKGVNLGAIRCDEMVAEDGCAGHRAGCNTATRTCVVR